MRKSAKNFLVAAPMLATALTACAPMHASLEDAGFLKKGDEVEKADPIQCVLDAPDYVLKTDLLSFEMVDKYKISLGFSLIKGLFKAIGLDFEAANGTLGMSMAVYDPLKPRTAITDAQGEGSASEIKFDASLMAHLVDTDLGYYYKTPLRYMSEDALKSTLGNVIQKLASRSNEWSARVYDVMAEDELLVRVGRTAGLVEGDEFKIFNIEYKWEGTACESNLVIARKLSTEPVAIATVTQLEPGSAILKITKRNSEDAIRKGAFVTVSKLVAQSNQAQSRALARSIKLGEMTQGKIVFSMNGFGKEVDLRPFISHQLKDVTNEFGLYVKE